MVDCLRSSLTTIGVSLLLRCQYNKFWHNLTSLVWHPRIHRFRPFCALVNNIPPLALPTQLFTAAQKFFKCQGKCNLPCGYTNHDHPDKIQDFLKISRSEDGFRTMKWLHIFLKSATCLEPSIPTVIEQNTVGVSDKETLCRRVIYKFVRSFIIFLQTTRLPQLAVLLITVMYLIQAVISSFHSVQTFGFLAFRFGLIL